MRYYVKVADPGAGIGWSRGFWTRKGVEREAENLSYEYGPAVWLYTRKEKSRYNSGQSVDGEQFSGRF